MNSILADRVCSLKSGENLAPFPLIFNEIGIGENVMGKRIEYRMGQILGDYGISFIARIKTELNKPQKAKFVCHCNEEFISTIVSVKRNHTKSCGCLLKVNMQYKKDQIVGDHKIKFVHYYKSDSKDMKAVFKCHCGKEFINCITKIKNSNVKSCGCIRGKNGLLKYVPGQKIGSNGFILIKEIEDKIGRERMALVKCRCGKEYISTISKIKNNYVKSCGCNRWKAKRIEYEEGQVLGSYGIKFIRDAGINKSGQRLAIFRCHCGSEFTATINTIKCNAQKACGNHKVWNRIKYKEGQIIGDNNIKFIKNAGKNNHNQREAFFKCYCGNEFITEINSIKTNNQKSCGCANDDRALWCRIEYTKGQLIGDYGIKFIKEVEIENKRRSALMECSCGNEFITTIQGVKSNIATTCGCSSKSLGEDKITDILKSKNINFYPEYRDEKCRDRVALPFDFAIKKDSQILSFIEYDGLHHFESIDFFGGEKNFLYVQKHDQIKNEYCEANNIPLLRIPYTKFNDIEDIVSDFLIELEVI